MERNKFLEEVFKFNRDDFREYLYRKNNHKRHLLEIIDTVPKHNTENVKKDS